jgi:hypothetical protein
MPKCRAVFLLLATVGIGSVLWIAVIGEKLSATSSTASASQDVRAHELKPLSSAAPSRDLFDKYCVSCHNARLKTGNLSLENVSLTDVSANAPTLEKVVAKLRLEQMPPPGKPQPDPAAKRVFVSALEGALDKAATVNPNPGYVRAHRLTRLEYVNAIRDLLGLEIDGPALLPDDAAAVGFDNDSGVLNVTPTLVARYVSAATKISRLAMSSSEIRPTIYLHRAPRYVRQETRMGEDQPFGTIGGTSFRYVFPLDGEYSFKLRLQRAEQYETIRGLDYDINIDVRIDKKVVRRFKVEAKFPGHDYGGLIAPPEDDVENRLRHDYRLNADNDLEFRIAVKAGMHLVSAAFTGSVPSFEHVPNQPRSYKISLDQEDAPAPGIDKVEITGPYNAEVVNDSASRRKILECHPAGVTEEDPCAERIVRALAQRAYRRPVTAGDVQPLLEFYRKGRAKGRFDDGIERALEALLASPDFLFRAEKSLGAAPGSLYRIGDIELASRLSFFLWSSIPDDALLSLAVRGKLSDPVVLEEQVRRMLADSRATAFIDNFTNQWLITRNASSQELDPERFPDFDGNLSDALVREMELFLDSQVRDDRSVLDLLRADYTFLNERLAKHYAIPNVYGSHFRRVTLTDERRFGLLGKGAVHLVSSYANRTSVVLRGKWILEYLLDAPPAPPPPNVPELKASDARKPTSLRQRMEQHRSNPVCSACHSAMDPYGFAMENFDPTGRWRTTDEGVPVDTASSLPDGTKIDGIIGLRTFLVEKRGEAFVRTVTRKLLAYAICRGIEYYDMPAVRQIMKTAAQNDYRWSSLIMGIVQSKPFRMGRVPQPPPVVVARSNDARP